MCSRVIVLEKGRKAYDGPVDEGIKFLHYDDDNENALDVEEEMAEDEEMGADI
jgi:ABC-2 type transport system ATP-binding protein